MSGWYRRFIPNFSSTASPLTDLLKLGKKIVWALEAQKAFDQLKAALTTNPVLVNPNYKLPFFIQCDASSTGVGAVLFQKSDDAKNPIAFVSQKLNPAQRKYSVTELECYAAVLAVKKFRSCIEGFEFTILTDNTSLKWLMDQKDLSGRLARWSLKLQAFKFHIEHRKGSQNCVPDALSRVHSHDELFEEICELGDTTSLPLPDLEYIQRMKTVEEDASKNSNLRVENNKLYIAPNYNASKIHSEIGISEWKLFIPAHMTHSLIMQAHCPPISAHPGVAKTLEKLQRLFYWPKMAADVKNFVSTCDSCKASKPLNFSTQLKMGDFIEVQRSWQFLYLDFYGPYPRSKNGNTHLLIVLDKYSRFPLLKPMREATAAHLVDFLEHQVFDVFSVPEIIFTDNGRQFESKLLESLLTKYGIKHVFTPKYSPQSNASERVNNVCHSSTGFSPHYLIFGQHKIGHGSEYELLKKLDCLGENEISIASKSNNLSLAQEQVLFHLREAYDRNKNIYNLRSNDRHFYIGQEVMVRNFVQSDKLKKFSAKLAPKFIKGKIQQRLGKVAYKIVDSNEKLMGTYHIKDIRN